MNMSLYMEATNTHYVNIMLESLTCVTVVRCRGLEYVSSVLMNFAIFIFTLIALQQNKLPLSDTVSWKIVISIIIKVHLKRELFLTAMHVDYTY